MLTALDNCGIANVTGTVDTYTENCLGYSITYRWTATDDCGNTNVVSQLFNVLADDEAPVFDKMPDAMTPITCDETLPPHEVIGATDACGTVVVTTSIDTHTSEDCATYDITYRWIATDNCGNISQVTQILNVLADTQAPVFDSLPDPINDISCNDPLPVLETITVKDNCNNVSVTPTRDPYTINVCDGYDITYRWTAGDACGNVIVTTQIFSVLPDTQAPVFDSLPDPISDISCSDPLPALETLTVKDDCSNVSITPNADPFIADECTGYSITYRWVARDACGNVSEVTTSFNVLPDVVAPVLDSLPDFISDIQCGDPLPTQEVLTATDDCGTGDVTPTIDPYTIDNCLGYSITYRWTASDDCDNRSEVTRTFNVLPDVVGPVFTNQPQSINDIRCDESLPNQQDLTATDICGTTTVSYTHLTLPTKA